MEWIILILQILTIIAVVFLGYQMYQANLSITDIQTKVTGMVSQIKGIL